MGRTGRAARTGALIAAAVAVAGTIVAVNAAASGPSPPSHPGVHAGSVTAAGPDSTSISSASSGDPSSITAATDVAPTAGQSGATAAGTAAPGGAQAGTGGAAAGQASSGGSAGGPGANGQPSGSPAVPPPAPEPNRAAPTGPPPKPEPGAAWSGDFPDPSILRVGTTYYAYSTEAGLTHVQTLTSTDLVNWQYIGEALPELPPWSGGLAVWAPHVVKSATGYVMFYASKDNRTGDQCLGRAFSLSPQGPFVDTSANPFVCQIDQGGDIDPDPFVDDNGAQWLIWKSQGTLTGLPSRLWSEPVAGDWALLSGTATPLVTVSQPWEVTTVERPAMVRQGGAYFLLYSGNDWWTGDYAVGYAVCRSLSGPCSKPATHPILSSHGNQAGPGSCSFFTDLLGHVRVAYDAWAPPRIGYPGGRRSMHLAGFSVSGLQPSITGT